MNILHSFIDASKLYRLLASACFFALQIGLAHADYPLWWVARDVVDANAVSANDFAATNQGQLKFLASQAYMEFYEKLPDCDLASISNLVAGFSLSNNFSAVNMGQLKFVAKPFYDVLWSNSLTNAWPFGMDSGPYPWSAVSGADDYALANLGQLKYIFSFDLNKVVIDSDGDGMPDEWEVQYLLNPFSAVGVDGPLGDPDHDQVVNLWEYRLGLNPQNPRSTSGVDDFLVEHFVGQLGDVDGNGVIDSGDADFLSMALGSSLFVHSQFATLADMNVDGVVNHMDLALLNDLVSGKPYLLIYQPAEL